MSMYTPQSLNTNYCRFGLYKNQYKKRYKPSLRSGITNYELPITNWLLTTI